MFQTATWFLLVRPKPVRAMERFSVNQLSYLISDEFDVMKTHAAKYGEIINETFKSIEQ